MSLARPPKTTSPPPRPRRAGRLTRARFPRALFSVAGALVVAALALSGCVTIYQPMGSLQRPVLVGLHEPNLEATRLLVRCLPSDHLPYGDAEKLCRNVSQVLRNQGADVEFEVPRRGGYRAAEEQRPDMVVELSSRVLSQKESPLLGVAWCLTCTLVPLVSEHSFLQRVVVFDDKGNLLASDEMPSRFIDYNGVLVWSVNWLLDVFVRADEDDVTGDGPHKDYSRDFYGQVSQLTYNARVRQRLLREGTATPPPPAQD